MTKVILALHVTDPSPRLATPALRKSLADGGATAVQLNLDDAAVEAAAMRFGPGAPITALVSVWTDGDPAATVRTVAEAAPESAPHAYRVREHVRLDPVPVPDGVRSDAMVNIALLRRPESMPREEYLRYWRIHHTPIAIRTQNTVAYIQNTVEEVLTPATPDVSAIVEEHFPMAAMTDPHAFYGSRGDDRELDRRVTELMTSVARFGAGTGLDLVPTSRYRWTL